jgi:hypothetical protein
MEVVRQYQPSLKKYSNPPAYNGKIWKTDDVELIA